MYNTFFQLAEKKLAGLCSFQHSADEMLVPPAEGGRDDQKPTLLLLHGWQDNAASFDALFESLARHCHLVAIDWPGHGYSDKRDADNYYHFFDYIDDLHQLVEQLSASPLYLVGHSLGALVAGCYAAAFPYKVAGVVMIEGLAPLYESADNAAARLQQGIESRQRHRRRVARRPVRRMNALQEALDLRCTVNRLPESCLRPLVLRGTETDGEHWYWRHDDRLRCDSLYRMVAEHAQALMSQIQCPVLSIVGDQGFSHLQRTGPEKSWFERLRQVQVQGGHHCHMESPQDVCRHILMFTARF